VSSAPHFLSKQIHAMKIGIVQKCVPVYGPVTGGSYYGHERSCHFSLGLSANEPRRGRYLSAPKDVAHSGGFASVRRRVTVLPGEKPPRVSHCRSRWYSFLRYRLSKTAMTSRARSIPLGVPVSTRVNDTDFFSLRGSRAASISRNDFMAVPGGRASCQKNIHIPRKSSVTELKQ